MKSKTSKLVVLAALLLFFSVTAFGGIMAKNGANAYSGGTTLYECDFESLATDATEDDIYFATWVAGAKRSVVEAEDNYIEAIYTFYDNGCQHQPLYLDTNRGINSTDTSKTYTLELEFMTFGSSVNNMILSLQGPDVGTYNSVVTFNADGTAYESNYALSDFITLKSATLGDNGWWTATIEMKGTGGYVYPVFYMNIVPADYETVNASLDTGIRLSEFKMTEGETSVYDLTVTTGISGSDALYHATGFGYGGHSVVTKAGAGIEGKSLKAVYTFWDNGFQHEGVYINENNVGVNLEEGKQYVVEMDVKLFGNAKEVYSIFNQVGSASGFDSQVILKSNGTYSIAEYQTEMFESVEVTNNGGVFHIEATINGMGGLLKFYFNMYTDNAEDANLNMNTGLYLDNVRIAEKTAESGNEGGEEYSALYERDFESLATDATEDDIYFATWVAGAKRSVVEAEDNYIEAIYTFYDNGCQHQPLYLDTNRGINSTDTSKTYTLELEFMTFGSSVNNMILSLQGPDVGTYNSVVTFNADGTAYESNYALSDFITLKSATLGDNGWWTATIEMKGTGGYVYPVFYMNIVPADYETVNASLDTGIRLSEFKMTEGETSVYDLTVTTGISGSDALYHATGFGYGGHSVVTKAGAGIEGKSLKAVYTFWDNGFQHEGVYINENNVGVNLEEGKQYVVEMDVKLFGNAKEVYSIFNQVGSASGFDSQVILKSNGTYSIAEYQTEMFESVEVTNNGGVFHIEATINGMGGLLKFYFNMYTDNAEDANLNMNTGLYLDNVRIAEKVEGSGNQGSTEPTLPTEWKTIYSQNFNKVDQTLSGSDAFFHATGFAGVEPGTITIGDGVDGSQCAKATYQFFEDGGWQIQSFYLNSSYTGSTSPESYYKVSMKLKPFGDWTAICVGFQNPSYLTAWITIYPDGAFVFDKIGCLDYAEVMLEDGIFTVNAYLMGTGSWIFNLFNMCAADPADANANMNTGLYLDDYVFAKEVKPEPAGVNKKAAYYNKASDGDFVTMTTFTAVDGVMIGETGLTAEQYAFEEGKLTIKKATLDAMANGTYTVIVATGDTAVEMQLVIASIPMGSVYTNDFSGMPDLSGDQDAKDAFFQNSYMDPANYNIWTVDDGDNRMIKFVAPDATDAYVSMFQTNPQGSRLSGLTKNKLHTIYMDLKPVNGTVLGIEGRVFDGMNVDVPWFYLEVDLAANKRADDGTQYANASWAVTAKADGWYTLAITIYYDGNDFSDSASAYLRFSAPASEQDVWYFDNFDATSELIPELRAEKNTYDIAADTVPYYIIDLCRTFEIESVTVNGSALTSDDYTTEVTPVGYTRIDFTKAYCANYDLGDEIAVVIRTTKGNEIATTFTVVDSMPAMEEDSYDYDKATKESLTVTIDFKGYDLASVTLNETALKGTEYNYNAESGAIEFKGAYLATLGVGDNTFTVRSSSGATCSFTFTVSDSTPVFGTAADYEKSQGGDYAIDLELNGKEIVSVTLGETALTAEQYDYSDGKLTVNESVMSALSAGKYTLTVTTLVPATAEITVNDAPPVFSGEYTATQGADLVITVDTHNKKILSVTVDGLELLSDEYSYENGKLTVKGSVFEEVATGERQIVLTTEGGEATLTFTLQIAGNDGGDTSEKKGKGCFGDIGTVASLTAIVTVLGVCLFIRKKEKRSF